MSNLTVRVENLGKCYKIGQANSGDFRESFSGWWNRLRGRNTGPMAESEEFWALKNINFEIKKGEAVGIIGQNGAGKSTLLKILSRITEPSKGRFEINGRVSSLLEVGTGFHPELSGRENIYLNGTILGMKRREINSKFDEIVAFSGVEKFIDTAVKHYSSGMKVRLAFSVAAHLEPEVLIIDEVLAVGDAEFQKKCLGKMNEVSKNEGRTVLFVSHDMSAIMRLCERVLILKEGGLFYNGGSKNGVESYLSSAVIGSASFYKAKDTSSFFQEAKVLNSKGQIADVLKFGEPFSVGVSLKKREAIPNLVITCKILDRKQRLITVANTMNSPSLGIGHAGESFVRMSIDVNVLVPGKYSVDFGAFIRPHTQISITENCLSFEVSKIPFNEQYDFNIVLDPVVNVFEKWCLEN